MDTFGLTVNGQVHTAALAQPDTPLRWMLRDGLQLARNKQGCGALAAWMRIDADDQVTLTPYRVVGP